MRTGAWRTGAVVILLLQFPPLTALIYSPHTPWLLHSLRFRHMSMRTGHTRTGHRPRAWPLMEGRPTHGSTLSLGQEVGMALSRRGAGSYVRGDLRSRPFISSVALSLSGIIGATIGGVTGGLDGIMLGSAIGWSVASLGDVIAARISQIVAQRKAVAEARRRSAIVARCEAAEGALQATLNRSPVSPVELRRVLKEARDAGVDARAQHLTRCAGSSSLKRVTCPRWSLTLLPSYGLRRATALLELLERPLVEYPLLVATVRGS